jgi:hypothetical protein
VTDHADPRVVERAEDGGRGVGGAVVDDDQLDLAREVDVEDLLDCLGHAGCLVEDGHDDRQLHGRCSHCVESPQHRPSG